MQNQNSNVERQYRTLMILWFALIVSQFIFLAVLFFAKREVFNFDFSKSFYGEKPQVVIIFAVLGVFTFIASFTLGGLFKRRAISERRADLVQSALIVGCALCEATSLCGLVLAFAFNYQYFFLWFALGIFGMILHFPKRDNLIAASYKG